MPHRTLFVESFWCILHTNNGGSDPNFSNPGVYSDMNVHLITMLKVFTCLILMGLTGITIGGVSETYVYAGF